MQPRAIPDIPVYRRHEVVARSVDERRLRSAVQSGAIVRVLPGVFVRADDWRGLAPIDRHLLLVVEAVDRLDGPVRIVGASAAAVWGIDRLGEWPRRVEVVLARTTGGRSSGLFHRRTVAELDVDAIPWRGHLLATPSQTAVDLARRGTALEGLVAMDQALWARRGAGPLASSAEIAQRTAALPSRSAADRATTALSGASSLADSVRETQSRYLIRRLGFPEPILQRRFVLPSGKAAFSDFYFPDHDHAGEFDGTGKYFDPALLGGRTPRDALLAEKDRGDELRRCVRRLSRWRTPALDDPRLLWDILTGDGLPSSKPRPSAELRLA